MCNHLRVPFGIEFQWYQGNTSNHKHPYYKSIQEKISIISGHQEASSFKMQFNKRAAKFSAIQVRIPTKKVWPIDCTNWTSLGGCYGSTSLESFFQPPVCLSFMHRLFWAPLLLFNIVECDPFAWNKSSGRSSSVFLTRENQLVGVFNLVRMGIFPK